MITWQIIRDWPQHSSLTLIAASLPMVAVTVAGSHAALPFAAVLSIVLLYFAITLSDQFLFSLTSIAAHLYFVAPIQAFVAIWGLVVAVFAGKAMALEVVALYAMLLLLAILPGMRFNRARLKRRIPLLISYSILGSLFMTSVARNFLLYLELL